MHDRAPRRVAAMAGQGQYPLFLSVSPVSLACRWLSQAPSAVFPNARPVARRPVDDLGVEWARPPAAQWQLNDVLSGRCICRRCETGRRFKFQRRGMGKAIDSNLALAGSRPGRAEITRAAASLIGCRLAGFAPDPKPKMGRSGGKLVCCRGRDQACRRPADTQASSIISAPKRSVVRGAIGGGTGTALVSIFGMRAIEWPGQARPGQGGTLGPFWDVSSLVRPPSRATDHWRQSHLLVGWQRDGTRKRREGGPEAPGESNGLPTGPIPIAGSSQGQSVCLSHRRGLSPTVRRRRSGTACSGALRWGGAAAPHGTLTAVRVTPPLPPRRASWILNQRTGFFFLVGCLTLFGTSLRGPAPA
jgi:hypothetical protein